jgi:hypothetical protein
MTASGDRSPAASCRRTCAAPRRWPRTCPLSTSGPVQGGELPRGPGGAARDDAAGLSATNIARLTNEWEAEYRTFQKRNLADRDYVWVDGVHFNFRLEDDRICTLVMIGMRPDGRWS